MSGFDEPTINDVAAMAGVSIRTVSRVLNRSTKVNAATREKIEAAIAALDFRPSSRARALAMGRSLLIGLVHNDRNALVLDSLQRGIAAEASAQGYELIVHSVPGEQVVGDVLAFARRSRVDGLVIVQPVAGAAGLADALVAEGVPAVCLSSVPVEGYAGVILSGERAASAEVARFLVGLGHRRIAMIAGPADVASAQERKAGFMAGLAEHGLELVALAEGDYGFASGLAAAEALLDGATRPSAIFACNDMMAAAVLKAAAARGLAVPRDLSVVGFDGSMLAQIVTPALTTVHRPFGEMAQAATRALLDTLAGVEVVPVEPLPLRLIVAESTAVKA
ncbi:LacI family DNA-binding transcriptional regulator [Novosphingobium sp. SL115]|uniref:LacI family DNA-binding transcriptional regulator n=1 Tax=Novosphingobium sp. SL115 TaxID=2995150 RepID=UPI0022731FFF|nr:LacI family DNA-binding transcriptional regulator [Novosphingobium sp. SL115]MCY1673019.1 LacI family DNA-binding transcriptional regulator [Novosphingobium sp. SL115]